MQQVKRILLVGKMDRHLREVVTQILSLPIYGDLPMQDVDYVCDAILEFFGKFTTANPSVGGK